MEEAKRSYGLFTCITLVVGTVIGCGVFIKAGSVLKLSGGSLPLSLLAWFVGGIIMISSSFCFAVYATKVEKFNGSVDYVEYASNRTFGYYFGYFLANVYFPLITANLSFVAASYLVAIFTDNSELYNLGSYPVLIIALSLIVLFSLLNFFAPKICHFFQVSVLFVKLLPIIIVLLISIFAKFVNADGGIIKAFTVPGTIEGVTNNFGEAVKITSYAYDGWICVTAFNKEIKNSKKNLPKAIMIGTIAVLVFYLVYFIGCSAIATNATLVEDAIRNASTPLFAGRIVFAQIFNFMPLFGEIMFLTLVFISCTGNINVMTLSNTRGMIALGYRGEGLFPEPMARVVKGRFTYVPHLAAFIVITLYTVIWHLAYRGDVPFFNYLASMDSIVCSVLYGGYIVVYIYMMRHFKDETIFKRFVMPIIAIAGSLFFVFCGTGLYQLIVDKDPTSLIGFACFATIILIVYVPGIIVFYKYHQAKEPAIGR